MTFVFEPNNRNWVIGHSFKNRRGQRYYWEVVLINKDKRKLRLQCIFGALFLGITSVALIIFIFEWENGSEALLEAHKTVPGESLMLTTPKSNGSQILTGLAEFNPLGVMLIVILVSLLLMAVGCWSVAQWYYVSPVRNVIRHILSKRQGRA